MASRRFKYDDGIMSHFKRTGKKESTILIEGPVGTKDVLHKIGDVLTQWGIQKPPMKKLGFFGMY